MKPELSFIYDAEMRPIAGKCTACGEPMPPPPADARDNVDTILWLSHHFLIHKKLKHAASPDTAPEDTSA